MAKTHAPSPPKKAAQVAFRPNQADRPTLANASLRSLEIFVNVAESGGMTAAAERLGISQSAVSQAMRNLEESSGQVLLDRSVRPPTLTASGSTVLQHATGIVQQFRELQNALQSEDFRPVPQLRIGVASTFIEIVGPSLIDRIGSLAHRLAVTTGLAETRIAGLVDRRVDLLLTFDEAYNSNIFDELPVLSEPYFIALPAGFDQDFETIRDLSQKLPLLRTGKHLHNTNQIEAYLAAEGGSALSRDRFDTTDGVVAMVAAGLGWSLITPLTFLKSLPFASRMRCALLPGRTLERRLTLIARKRELGSVCLEVQRSAVDVFDQSCMPVLRKHIPEIAQLVRIGEQVTAAETS